MQCYGDTTDSPTVLISEDRCALLLSLIQIQAKLSAKKITKTYASCPKESGSNLSKNDHVSSTIIAKQSIAHTIIRTCLLQFWK